MPLTETQHIMSFGSCFMITFHRLFQLRIEIGQLIENS
ncbi:uncharacterized protein METZ01_LOCUS219493 [marine metagenome]|uniref:Uncharacterized protein n=1 Tax=marine metagenome TaxID=408172 RepID=A0A382FVH9_9ZZZZ